MARNMDKYADLIAEFDQVSREYTKAGQEFRRLEDRKQLLNARLTKIMGSSTVGTLNGVDTLEVFVDERRSVTIAQVEKFAPEKFDDLVITSRKDKVRFIKGVR